MVDLKHIVLKGVGGHKLAFMHQLKPLDIFSHDVMDSVSKDANVKRGIGPDPTKPKSKKKKELRKEKALAKMLAAGKTEADYLAKNAAKTEAKTVEDLTSLEFPPDRLVNTIS